MKGTSTVAALRRGLARVAGYAGPLASAARGRWSTWSRRRQTAVVALLSLALLGVFRTFGSSESLEDSIGVRVTRGDLRVEIPVAGRLVPATADSYGGEIQGAELKILELAPEGARVPAGTVLIRFDDAAFRREVDSARARLVQARSEAEQARQSLRVLTASQKSEELEGAAALRRAELESDTYRKGLGPLALAESESTLEMKRREAEDARIKVTDLEPFALRGYISQDELRAARRRKEQAEAALAIATRQHEALTRFVQPQTLSLKEADVTTRRQAMKTAGEKAAAQVGQVKAALQLAESRVLEAERAEADANRRVDLCVVRARAPGLVVYRDVFEKGGEKRRVRVGDSTFAGQPLLDLPDLSRMLLESRVRETEIHGVRPGLPAEVRLDAFPFETFGASVLRLGALSAGEGGGDRTFPLVLELKGSDSRLRPGMAGQAVVLGDFVRDALLVPVDAVRRDRQGTYCLVRGLCGVRRRPVVIGLSDAFSCEVKSGISDADVVLVGGT